MPNTHTALGRIYRIVRKITLLIVCTAFSLHILVIIRFLVLMMDQIEKPIPITPRIEPVVITAAVI
jgi:hypothetical protein